MLLKSKLLWETLTVYAASVFLIWLSFLMPGPEGIVPGVVIILCFFAAPHIIVSKTGRDPDKYAIGTCSLTYNILIGLGFAGAVLPVFSLVYVLGSKYLISALPVVELGSVLQMGFFDIFKKVGESVLFNIIFVGVTEETFFRGYVQGNLNRIFKKRWSLFGIEYGPSLYITAFLFGIIHIIWWGNPFGILVVIPGIAFGFIRELSSCFIAPAVFHGLCNVTIFTLTGSIFVT